MIQIANLLYQCIESLNVTICLRSIFEVNLLQETLLLFYFSLNMPHLCIFCYICTSLHKTYKWHYSQASKSVCDIFVLFALLVGFKLVYPEF